MHCDKSLKNSFFIEETTFFRLSNFMHLLHLRKRAPCCEEMQLRQEAQR